jgi:DeoR/GlpR family transcriptional regulator of sugar metabolism
MQVQTEDKSFTRERHQKIIDHLNLKGRVAVDELSSYFNVTGMTIRRDLLFLEKQGFLYRVHGGALKRETKSIWQMSTLQDRLCQNAEEKEQIALCVAELIKDNESVMIDGGSTTTKVAQHLQGKKELLIVSNALTIGEILVQSNNKVILTGGELLKETNALIGNATNAALASYRTDKAIIGVSGLVPDEGLFSAIPQEAEVKKLMLQNSRLAIVAVDSSKIGTRAFYMFSDLKDVDILVTDRKIKKDDLSVLEKAGIEVIVV